MLYARRRHRDTLAANLSHDFHIPPDLFQSLGSPGGVLDNPFRERNRTFHSQATIGDAVPQVRQGGRPASNLVNIADPGFNSLITRLSGNLDLVCQIEAIAADGRGVQAVAKSAAVIRG